jgi:hypothetical protein
MVEKKDVDPQGRKVDPVTGNARRVSGKDSGLPADAVAEPAIQDLHDQMALEREQGFRGEPADPTPNEHYTVAGVLDPSKHVPEEFKQQTGVRVMPDPNYGQK